MGKTEEILILVAFNLFFFLFIIAYILFFRQYIIKKKEYDNKLALQKLEHKKELLDTQVEVQLQTMQHIGREIHDNVGQQITLASLLLQQVLYENENFENEKLNNIDIILKESLITLRSLSKSLFDDSIETDSICKLIEKEVKKISLLKKYKINYICNDDINLNYNQKTITLRIVQEFLQNSLKHSECKNINIELSKLNSQFHLIVQDDGIGFNIKNLTSNGIGLLNINKRVEVLGGKCLITSSPNYGTKLEINYNLEE
jgi:signal transduction histidine kinase